MLHGGEKAQGSGAEQETHFPLPSSSCSTEGLGLQTPQGRLGEYSSLPDLTHCVVGLLWCAQEELQRGQSGPGGAGALPVAFAVVQDADRYFCGCPVWGTSPCLCALPSKP